VVYVRYRRVNVEVEYNPPAAQRPNGQETFRLAITKFRSGMARMSYCDLGSGRSAGSSMESERPLFAIDLYAGQRKRP